MPSIGMSDKEWMILAKSLKCAYTGQNFLPDDFSIKLWYKMLCDIPYPIATSAVQKYICENHFPPTISDIRNAAAEIMAPASDWSEGWAEVQKAIRRYGYMQEAKALESMSPVTRETVKRIGWMNICSSPIENAMTDRANFRNIYQTIEERRKEELLLSDGLKKSISMIQDGQKKETGLLQDRNP